MYLIIIYIILTIKINIVYSLFTSSTSITFGDDDDDDNDAVSDSSFSCSA